MGFSGLNIKNVFFRKAFGPKSSAVFAALIYFAETAVLWAEEASETAAEMKLDPLAWKGDLALWTAVVFLILLLILGKFAFGPIVKALDLREKNELARVEAAERANADAKALLETYRQRLADASDEVRQIISEARRDAEKQAATIVEDARKAAAHERERALKDIQEASDVALQDIAVKSAELATSLAGKILKEEIDSSAHARLIESAVGEIKSK
jgi:F-type H+-transporting ATPase subunit b